MWNRSLSSNANMELLQVNSFVTPTHAHAQKISYMCWRIYTQSSSKRNTTQKSWIGFSPIGFDVTQAIFNSISHCMAQFYKSRVHAARHGRSQHRNQQSATSKQMVSKKVSKIAWSNITQRSRTSKQNSYRGQTAE